MAVNISSLKSEDVFHFLTLFNNDVRSMALTGWSGTVHMGSDRGPTESPISVGYNGW